LSGAFTDTGRCLFGSNAKRSKLGAAEIPQHQKSPRAVTDSEDPSENPYEDQWWITSLGDILIWARLRVLESGVAEVFNAEGETLRYDDEDAAQMALLDAEYRAFDGLDDDDATMLGIELDSVEPPMGNTDEELLPVMTENLLRRHN
jgi:hypothetical protein